MFQSVIHEIEGGGRSADWLTLEATADAAHAKAGRRLGVEFVRSLTSLVESHGCLLAEDDGFPPGEHGLVLDDTLVVRRVGNLPRHTFFGAHEFGHWLDRRHRMFCTHADIQCLTLMLAWPMVAIRQGEGPLLPIPAELVVYRANMTPVMRLLARQGRLSDFV